MIQGFTLLELLVVVTLLAILSSVALMSNDGTREQVEVDATKYEMAELRKALLQFKRDVGAFPNDLLQLGSYSASAVTANGDIYTEWDKDTHRGWNGPYLSAGFDKDAWNTPYAVASLSCDTASKECWCDATGSNCQELSDATHTLQLHGDSARIISNGSNKQYEGINLDIDKTCQKKNDASEDIVVCLLK
jgi:prepilin-type N-terminal cleavage/methylation domain-containing protein